MANLTIRNVDDAVVAKLKSRAKDRQRSFEAELREILKAATGIPDPIAVEAAGVALDAFLERARTEGWL